MEGQPRLGKWGLEIFAIGADANSAADFLKASDCVIEQRLPIPGQQNFILAQPRAKSASENIS